MKCNAIQFWIVFMIVKVRCLWCKSESIKIQLNKKKKKKTAHHHIQSHYHLFIRIVNFCSLFYSHQTDDVIQIYRKVKQFSMTHFELTIFICCFFFSLRCCLFRYLFSLSLMLSLSDCVFCLLFSPVTFVSERLANELVYNFRKRKKKKKKNDTFNAKCISYKLC